MAEWVRNRSLSVPEEKGTVVAKIVEFVPQRLFASMIVIVVITRTPKPSRQ